MAEPITSQPTEQAPHHVARNLKLRCCHCGTSGVYDVGTVLYEREGEGKSAETQYSFTGYFRCQRCNSPGPWELEDNLKLLSLGVRSLLRPKNPDLQPGHYAIIEGTVLQTPAMAEDYLLQRIQEQPRNAALHRRLGSILRGADQLAKAGEWYAKALALDPHELQARYHLFNLAILADDTPTILSHARLLVRDLLAGYTARSEREDITETLAGYLVEDLRASPDTFRRHFLGPDAVQSNHPEEVFIRTLLTQEGEEEDVLVDAIERLLVGVPEPTESVAESMVAGLPVSPSATPPAPAAPPPVPALDLVPSLTEVVRANGLEASKLTLALDAPDDHHIRVQDKHAVFVTDGQKAAVWPVASLTELFRGQKAPPPDMDHFPPDYVPHFSFVEKRLLGFCDIIGDRTDQEMEEVYAALRRRPDGRSLNVTHDLVWQTLALLLGTHVLSAAEYEALVGALLGSARRWGLRPISRNYFAYLRQTFGYLRPTVLPPY